MKDLDAFQTVEYHFDVAIGVARRWCERAV